MFVSKGARAEFISLRIALSLWLIYLRENMIMAYGNYTGYGYGYPQYNTNMGYQQYQNPMMQNMVQPQQQTSEVPFSEMHFGTMKEAEAHIVTPNKSVLFLNNPLGEIYVKSADGMGNPSFKTYKQVVVENNTSQPVSHEFDTKDFVKTQDLDKYLTKDDLRNFIKREELINFATLEDLSEFDRKLEKFQKQMVGNMLKGGNDDGKQPNNNG